MQLLALLSYKHLGIHHLKEFHFPEKSQKTKFVIFILKKKKKKHGNQVKIHTFPLVFNVSFENINKSYKL